MKICVDTLETPLGKVFIAIRNDFLCALEFYEEWPRAEARLRRLHGFQTLTTKHDDTGTVKRIVAYFAGNIEVLREINIDPDGTEFQRGVWQELRKIPAGKTLSYSELAQRIGCPLGFRAVGTANRLNPIAIVVPCHRVIGSDGGLRGYAGGLERKRWLLDHEAKHCAKIQGSVAPRQSDFDFEKGVVAMQ